MKDQDISYRKALQWIHSRGRFGSRPGLERMQAVLNLLGNPHHQLSFAHIGGTNGKGSTAAMLASIFRAAGYSVGLFTSPYLLSFTNRMTINGEDIGREELVELADLVRMQAEAVERDPALGPMTEFEVVTTLALLFFARRKSDLVVFEVGLGGRLDATNVVNPLLSIITNVSLEHTNILGDTVEAIAGEKAGIIKKGVPVLTATCDPAVLKVIEARAAKAGAPLYRVHPPSAAAGMFPDRPFFQGRSTRGEGQYFDYYGFQYVLEKLYLPLKGFYQLWNAATALAASELIASRGLAIKEETLRRGLGETSWPGRLEKMQERPLLIMDGAHNPEAMRQLALALPEYYTYRHLILVFGALVDKDVETMLERILPLTDTVILTRPSLPRAADPQKLAGVAREVCPLDSLRIIVEEDLKDALKGALGLADPEDLVLVTGSLYTVSDARNLWQQGAVRPAI